MRTGISWLDVKLGLRMLRRYPGLTIVGGIADQCLEPHPYGFGICGGTTHGARLLEELFVNVESLLHTDDLAISFHPEQPDGSP